MNFRIFSLLSYSKKWKLNICRRDLYAILGVDKKATLDEIRKAYIEKTKQVNLDNFFLR